MTKQNNFYSDLVLVVEKHMKLGITAEVVTGSLFRAMSAVNAVAEEMAKQLEKERAEALMDKPPFERKGMNTPNLKKV